MKKIFLIAFLFISFATSSQNYHITGKIINAESKQALPDVNVCFQGSHIGTITNNNGSFYLPDIPAGEYVLGVSAIGYELRQQHIHVNKNISGLVVEIKEKSIELDQVVVTASRTERNLKDVPIAVQVISGKSIEKMQTSNMRDLLEYELPGVEFTNNGGYANINMLGFGGKYVLFLIDGERMAGESFDNIDYNRIDMENIERIEIIKGASSSLYGSNAVGGVINIITKKPAEKVNVQASTRIGSQGEQNHNLLVSSKQKWGALSLSGSYKERDPYLLKDRSPLSQEFENGEVKEQTLKETYIAGYQDYSIHPKMMFNIGKKLQLEAKGGYFFKERHPGGMDGKKVRDRFFDYSGGLKGIYSISEKQHISISGSYDKYDKYNYYKLLNEKEKIYANEQLRFNVMYDLMMAGKHSLVAGMEYFSDELMTYMFDTNGNNDSRDAWTYSIFAQQDWVLSSKVTLVGALRYDYHSQFKGHFTPRLSAMYRPASNISIRGGYSGGFRSPTLKELYTDWFHPYGGGFQIIGNKDMKAESSNNFNLSAEGTFRKTVITTMAQFSIIDNKITNVWVNNDTTQYVNTGNAKIFSAELSILHNFAKNIHAKGSYTYVHDNLKKLSVVRPHTATLGIDYTPAVFKRYNPTFSFSGKFFSSIDIYGTGDINETDNNTGINKTVSEEYKVHYNAYSIWKLTLNQPLPFNFSLNAGINNLFDYTPAFSSFYSSTSPGRTFYVGLKWKLK